MAECCAKLENRSEPEQLGKDITVTRCLVCGRRHFEMGVDPVEVGIKFDG
jgi:hypothetical protein